MLKDMLKVKIFCHKYPIDLEAEINDWLSKNVVAIYEVFHSVGNDWTEVSIWYFEK